VWSHSGGRRYGRFYGKSYGGILGVEGMVDSMVAF
jgi:hypothetical protein